jgi:hypothetical protein
MFPFLAACGTLSLAVAALGSVRGVASGFSARHSQLGANVEEGSPLIHRAALAYERAFGKRVQSLTSTAAALALTLGPKRPEPCAERICAVPGLHGSAPCVHIRT